MLLNPVRRPRLFMSTLIQLPTVPGASPSTPPTSDSGSNQKPRGLWPNAHPLDHVGDVFSSQMCVYIPQNVPKPPRNRNLKNQNFDPVRIRTRVSGVIDSDVRHLNRQAMRALNMNAISENINLNGPLVFSHREETSKRLQHILTLTQSFSLKISKNSKSFWEPINLHQTIFRGADQFARIFKT